VSLFDATTFGGAPRTFQFAGGLLRAVPPVRRALQYHRYAFGAVDHGD
jgi:hypothetical protein